MNKPDIDAMKDALQSAYNCGAFPCPQAGKVKTVHHEQHCEACRVRSWLQPGRYLKPEYKRRWKADSSIESRVLFAVYVASILAVLLAGWYFGGRP